MSSKMYSNHNPLKSIYAQIQMPRKTAIFYSKKVNSTHLVIKLLTNIHQVKHYTLKGRLYRYDEGKPFFYKVITQDDQQVKLEQAGGAFRENSHIHYFKLTVLEGSKCHKFQLSCKEGSTLPRGEIFLLRILASVIQRIL